MKRVTKQLGALMVNRGSSALRCEVWVPPPDASRRPSGWKSTPLSGPSWPRSVASCRPVARSQSRTTRSQPADASRSPSGLIASLAYINVRELGRAGEPESRTVFYFSCITCLGVTPFVWFTIRSGWAR